MGPLHPIHTYPLWVGLPQIKLVEAQFSKGPGKMYSLKQAMLCLSLSYCHWGQGVMHHTSLCCEGCSV